MTALSKLWLVARHEYLTAVTKRSFLVATLAVPLLIVGIMAFSILTAIGGRGVISIGYVDHSGLIDPALIPAVEEKGVRLRSWADEAQARAALEAGQISAYWVLPADYFTRPTATAYYWDEAPGARAEDALGELIRRSLIRDLPPDVRARLADGVSLTVRAVDSGRAFSSASPLQIVLPFVIAFFFYFAVSSAGSYMLQAVTTEKENRTIEVLATSIAPDALIGGKAVGLMGVALTQLGLWALTGVAAALVGARYVSWLRNVALPLDALAIAILYFLPAFALVAGMMTILGAAVTEQQQGQQLAGLLNLLFVFPVFLLPLLLERPNHPLVVALTLFPTTALITVVVRWSATLVPLWQLVLSWALIVAAAVGSFGAAARVFRIGMLRYGQRLSLAGIVAAVRGRVVKGGAPHA